MSDLRVFLAVIQIACCAICSGIAVVDDGFERGLSLAVAVASAGILLLNLATAGKE